MDILEKADIKYLRDKLIEYVNDNCFQECMKDFVKPDYDLCAYPLIGQPNRIIREFEWRLAYNKLIHYSEHVGLAYHFPEYYSCKFNNGFNNQKRSEYEQMAEELKAIYYPDLGKAIFPVALAAWLTIDDFRWHNLNPIYPKDLQYGLVTKYPKLMTAMAMFALNINRYQFINYLRPGILEFVDEDALIITRQQIPIS